MRLTNLTPTELQCPYADCPAVYKDEKGRLVIIGEDVPEMTELLKGKTGAHERVIVIDPMFFKHVDKFNRESP